MFFTVQECCGVNRKGKIKVTNVLVPQLCQKATDLELSGTFPLLSFLLLQSLQKADVVVSQHQ